MIEKSFAVVVPMANESGEFNQFMDELGNSLDKIGGGTVYMVVDDMSVDNTLLLCEGLSKKDARFVTIYEPFNRNVVDAYLRGYREAYRNGHPFIIEMDAGMSHDPAALPLFLAAYSQGHECVFGCRFMSGGSMHDSGLKRVFLSRFGTWLSNLLLGTSLRDMTSGYQGFSASVVKGILDYHLLSTAHFYQTEIRYLLRMKKFIEIPIQYKAPSPRVSQSSIYNSLKVLAWYFMKRISFNAKIIE